MSLPLSLEFFPTKTPEGAEKLRAARQQLYALKPEFCSVTFGAGGSTQDGTLQAVSEIMAEGCAAAPHLSCIGQSHDSIRERLSAYAAKRASAASWRCAATCPAAMALAASSATPATWWPLCAPRRATTFTLKWRPTRKPPAGQVALADLDAFAAKVKAGANSGITQYFFNSDAYFRYVDDLLKVGVEVPVVPGIMPITSSTQLLRFSDACGAEIPRWIRMRLQAFGDDTASIKAFGLDVVTDLCDQLRHAGVPGIHFYTMNQAGATLEICRRLFG
jgi:methylenetetrahydrofolate reductase (NADPH)